MHGQLQHLRSLFVWNLGWIGLGVAWLGPLPAMAMSSFAAHMALHMMVVAIAAPLIAVGLAGRRFDPVRHCPQLFVPIIACLGELLIVWLWHSPRLHHWARFTQVGFCAEQSMFLLAGLWLWLSAVGGSRPRKRERSGAAVLALLLTSMHMTLLGALLALSPRVLFAHSWNSNNEWAIWDQHLGGAIMLVVGGTVFLVGGVYLASDLVSQPATRSQLSLGSSPRETTQLTPCKPLNKVVP